jgi:hypothetical protein
MAQRPKQTVNTVRKLSTIKRYIHYYNLLIGYSSGYDSNPKKSFVELLDRLETDINIKNPARLFLYSDRTFCVDNLTVRKADNLAFGRLCAIRAEDFPQVFNLTNGDTRDFDALESEGLVEYSHFVINYEPLNPHIAIEYNQYGGKILDFVRYFIYAGANYGITSGMGQQNIVNDSLSVIQNKIGRVSKLSAKAQRNNIDAIQRMENGLGSVMALAKDHFSLADVEIDLKFDYKHVTEQSSITKTIRTLIDKISNNPLLTDNFLKLTIDAENLERNSKIEAFDLLVAKVRSEIPATKDGKKQNCCF